MNTTRNFSIIAHIDHGKSTLADRMLEQTGTVEKRKMREQVLDNMELERERGITIKMQPVQMHYGEYILNLIDTPGHIDFAYEVSRSLKAVEGAILLVDATQGIQAQTFSVLHEAQKQNITIIPAVTKIDAGHARTEEVIQEIADLLAVSSEQVYRVSGKTGEGVEILLQAIVDQIPPPRVSEINEPRSLIFDFDYSDHRGIIVYTRVFDGSIAVKDHLVFVGASERFTALEVGVLKPEQTSSKELTAGSIGYIVTGLKKPGIALVGDTILLHGSKAKPLSGYEQPNPVVWASVYPESQDDLVALRQALERLRLTDAALSFEEELSDTLGRGFRCGFLGMLHLEIVGERLKREFDLALIITTPSVAFSIIGNDGEQHTIYTPSQFPDHGAFTTVQEPWVKGEIITPPEYVGVVSQLLYEHEGEIGNSENLGDRTRLQVLLPLRELYRNFFDKLKSMTSGYASLSYEMGEERFADVARLDVLVAEEPVPALARVVSSRRIEEEAHSLIERLYELLPRQQFAAKLQIRGKGRILASKTLKAYRKDVTAKLYGGDVTRKRKLLEKQKKGKKRMEAQGRVQIPHDVFLKVMKPR